MVNLYKQINGKLQSKILWDEFQMTEISHNSVIHYVWTAWLSLQA